MKTRARRAALYARVSTGGQTVENQLRELRSVAERHGWQIVAEFSDKGISGAKGREQRPGLDKLLEAVTRREVEIGVVVGGPVGSLVARPAFVFGRASCQGR